MHGPRWGAAGPGLRVLWVLETGQCYQDGKSEVRWGRQGGYLDRVLKEILYGEIVL